jgi:probable DNA repair protein
VGAVFYSSQNVLCSTLLNHWELTLPDRGRHELFDIEHLKALLHSGYCVLTPNYRMARGINAAWNQQQQEQGTGTWRSANIAPLEAWLQEKWLEAVRLGLLEPLVQATAGQISELWQDVIAHHQRDTKGYSLIRPTAAAEQAGRARDTLLRWQVDINVPRYRQSFELDEDCATFFCWQALFVEKLAALGMTSATDCLHALLNCADAMPPSKIVLLGFDDIPPLLEACVRALSDDCCELGPGAQPGQCRAYPYSDKRTELAAVARWAKELSQKNEACSIGIILPNMREDRPSLEYLLRREFDCLGANYTGLPVNFSTGMPLDRVPVVRDALSMLSMFRPRSAVNDVVALMQSRFHSMGDINSSLAIRFIRRLFDAGTEFITAGDLRYRASQAEAGQENSETQGLELGQLLMAMSAMRDIHKSALPSVWADRFSEVLDLWGWPGSGSLDSIEYQQVQLWYSLIDDYSAYDALCEDMAFEDAMSLLTRCCARQVSQPQTPDSNVQVLGLLEAAGLSFDYLWICDMQASIWPAAARPNPFIPISLQRDMKMPNASAEREWSFASGLMSQYVHSAIQVNASYAQQRDGVPEKPSALLEGFSWEPPPQGEVIDSQWLAMQKSSTINHIEDDRAPPVSTQELDTLRGGSGLIEDQSQCPFRAFTRRRLGVSPLGEAVVALSAADRGSLLHDALYHLWGILGDSTTLAAMSNEDTDRAVFNAVAEAIEALPLYKRGGMGQAYFDLEAARLGSLLQEWLQIERQRSEFKILAREENISLQLGQLSIQLRADRIDELPDGARFIIDYKSGVSTAQDWLGDRPAKPQLLLYGLAMQETVAGLAFAQVRTRDCKYTGAGQTDVATGVQSDIEKLVKDKMPVKDWEDLAAQWQDNLERLAREFVSGDAQVDPLQNASCTYCGLQALCRVGEL